MKLLNKILLHEAQRNLLLITIKDNRLLESKILSSIQPKVGREFTNNELETQKRNLLKNTRKELIKLAIREKELVLEQLNERIPLKTRTIVNKTMSRVKRKDEQES